MKSQRMATKLKWEISTSASLLLQFILFLIFVVTNYAEEVMDNLVHTARDLSTEL